MDDALLLTNFSVLCEYYEAELKPQVDLWVRFATTAKCKCLTMKTSLKRWDLAGIASLLQSSPYVETLVIDIISSPLMYLEYLIRSYDEVKHWKLKEVYFKSLLRTPEECQDLRFWRNFLHK
ncbi:hypothetical protein ACJW30_05G198900 [Castanea mollissima]